VKRYVWVQHISTVLYSEFTSPIPVQRPFLQLELNIKHLILGQECHTSLG